MISKDMRKIREKKVTLTTIIHSSSNKTTFQFFISPVPIAGTKKLLCQTTKKEVIRAPFILPFCLCEIRTSTLYEGFSHG